jgi:hypothetical protein
MSLIINPYGFATAGSSTATLTIASGKTASNLTDYPVYVRLADMPSGFWTAVASDGGNIRVKQSGSDIPFDVVKIDTSGHTGTLFFKAASLLAASSNVYTIEATSGLTMPAVGGSNGRNAVWSAFDFVCMMETATTASLVERTGNFGSASSSGSGSSTSSMGDVGAGCGVDLATATNKCWSFTGGSKPARTVFTMGISATNAAANVIANLSAIAYATSGTVNSTISQRDTTTDNFNQWDNINSWISASASLPSSPSGQIHRFHAQYNGSTQRKFYSDGSLVYTQNSPTTRPGTDKDVYLGAGNATGGGAWNGKIAYGYVRPQYLSADYLAAEYSNLNAPASFYSIV